MNKLSDLRAKTLAELAEIAKNELDLEVEDIEALGHANRKSSWIKAIVRGRASKRVLQSLHRDAKVTPLPTFKLIQT